MKYSWTIPALILLLAAIGWETGSRLSDLPGFILPPPSRILHVAIFQAPRLLPHAGITLVEILAGIALALAVAVPLAVAMFARPALERALAPFLVASQAIPVFALAPLLVVWLGYGLASKILMAAVIIFFPITVSPAGRIQKLRCGLPGAVPADGRQLLAGFAAAVLSMGVALFFRRPAGGA